MVRRGKRGGSGKGSIKHQIKSILDRGDTNKIGTSKRDARNAAKNQKLAHSTVHSINEMQKIRNTMINLGEFAKREYGVKDIWEIKPEHVQEYMKQLKDRNGNVGQATKGHKRNVETAVIKFERILGRIAKEEGRLQAPKLINGRTITGTDMKKPIDRSYSREEIEAIKKHMSLNVRDCTELAEACGLRGREVANLRVEHIREVGGRMTIDIPDKVRAQSEGRVSAAGITKGGRGITKTVPRHAEPLLHRMMAGKGPKDPISNVKPGTIRNGWARACHAAQIERGGFHNTRHTFSRVRFEEVMKERIGADRYEIEVPFVRTKMIENIDHGKSINYGMAGIEKELVSHMIKAADIVHAELGHGEGRLDLMRTYIL